MNIQKVLCVYVRALKRAMDGTYQNGTFFLKKNSFESSPLTFLCDRI